MIIHVSIPSTRPKEISQFLAKLIDGEAFPFPPVPGAWVTVPRDGSGNTIEVYPLGTVALPGTGDPDPTFVSAGPKPKPWEVQMAHDPKQTMVSGHHLALYTKKDKEEIFRLGKEMGFRTIACERAGIFGVIEMWIENQFMIELITGPELKRYLSFMNQAENVRKRFGAAA